MKTNNFFPFFSQNSRLKKIWAERALVKTFTVPAQGCDGERLHFRSFSLIWSRAPANPNSLAVSLKIKLNHSRASLQCGFVPVAVLLLRRVLIFLAALNTNRTTTYIAQTAARPLPSSLTPKKPSRWMM